MNKKSRKRKSSGFTLIEILVVVSVIAIISTYLIVNWRKNEKRYQVQFAAQELVQNLRKAQDMALSGKKYPGETTVPSAYGIYFNLSTKNSYLIFGDKNGNNTYQGGDILVETILLETGIEIYSLPASTLNTVFSIPDGFAIITPSAASATIVIRKSGYSCPSKFCKSIIIKNTGEISIQ